MLALDKIVDMFKSNLNANIIVLGIIVVVQFGCSNSLMRIGEREKLVTETRKEIPISSFSATHNGFRFVKDGRLRFYDLESKASVATATPGDVASAFFKGERLGWFSDTTGFLWFTDDGGVSWHQISGKNNVDILESPKFLDAKQGVFFNNSEVWLTVDGGHSWTSIYPTPDQSYATLHAQPMNVYFVEENVILLAMTNGEVLRWDKERRSWSRRGLPIKADILSIYCFSDRDCLAGANGGAGMFRSKDAGKNWIKVRTGLDESNIVSIDFGDSKIGISIEERVYHSPYDKPNYEGTLIRTVDGGMTWVPVSSIQEPLLEAHFVNGNMVWVLGEKSIYVSKDAGESWQRVVSVTDL